MAKRKPEINEYMGQFDEGTYQTGAIHPPKRSSGLVAFLLAAIILLGGICSALGILNIRLLQQLAQEKQDNTPISIASQPYASSIGSYLEELEGSEPQVPQDNTVQLQLVRSPYYSNTDGTLTQEQILDQNRDCLVKVQCLTHFGATQTGVGLVISSDGFILVNHHVVDAARRVFVTLSDGTITRAAVVGSDSFSDLAVLYVPIEGLTAAVFSTNQTLQITDPSFAVSDSDSIQESTIFSVSRTFVTKSTSLTLIQTCKGSDSGPVFDSFGNVIGFQVGHISQYFTAADTTGTGLVVPTDGIGQIVADLIRYGYVQGRPSLGIEVEAISKVYQQYWQLPGGLLLTEVEKSSNAALCGLQEGDILIALDGKPIHSRRDLYTALYNHQIGDTVTAVICRDQQKFTVKLTIEDNSHN